MACKANTENERAKTQARKQVKRLSTSMWEHKLVNIPSTWACKHAKHAKNKNLLEHEHAKHENKLAGNYVITKHKIT